MPVIGLVTQTPLMEKMVSNLREVTARNARVMAICAPQAKDLLEFVDDLVVLPAARDELMPSLSVIPLQLISYHIAALRGCDIDKPRNLAKSVTVE